MNTQEFDLLTDGWIPCLDTTKTLRLHSIRSALEGATSICAIEHESPVVRIATLRLLLAFCYRLSYANNVPISSVDNWKKLQNEWGNGISAQWIDQYLDQYRCRNKFRLFDDEHPFFQVAGLKCDSDKQPEPATRLAFEQFAGTPTSLWEHIPYALTAQEAALYLVTSQAFGASTSNTSTARVGNLAYSPTGRTFTSTYKGCVVWLEGNNLLETLMLNLVDYDLTDTDFPIWEKSLSVHALRARQPRKAKEGDLDKNGKQIKIGKKLENYKAAIPTGPVQLFTWPSRSVLLSKPEDGVIKTVHFTQGIALSDYAVDPMKPYYKKGEPVNLECNKAVWQDVHTLLGVQPNRNRTVLALDHAARSDLPNLRLNIVGAVQGDEAAKILLWRHERMPVPVGLLNDVNLIERLSGLLQTAERVANNLGDRIQKIAKLLLAPNSESPGSVQPDKKDVDKVTTTINPCPAYWARLEKHFYPLLENLPNDWDEATDDWKPEEQQRATNTWRSQVKHEAEQTLRESIRSLGTTARAIQAVARVRTNFNDSDLKKTTKRKRKGGKSRS